MLTKIISGKKFHTRLIVLNGLTYSMIKRIGLTGFGHKTNYFITIQLSRKLGVTQRKMACLQTVGRPFPRIMQVISGSLLRLA